MYKHILLPTDGSPLAQKTVRAGIRFAKAIGARVTGFYAAPPPMPVEYKGLLPVGFRDPVERARVTEKAANRYLSVIEKAARVAGVKCRVEHVTDDFPADAIVAAAKRNKCDLIVMSSHGRRGFRPSMLGSQSQRVLAQSLVPVLLVR